MLFTPLLTSASVGTLEVRSVCEPIRPLISRKSLHWKFYQAACEKINLEKKIVRCSTENSWIMDFQEYDLKYDKLVIGCGMQVNDFGIEGVAEYCHFMKETRDAVNFRRLLLTRLEESCTPQLPLAEVQKKLTFVIIGGGPTGVEFAGELSDFFNPGLSLSISRSVSPCHCYTFGRK
eukprot:UN29181